MTKRRHAPAAPVAQDVRTPLYHQIYLILRAKILDGTYAQGSLLPSEHALVELYGVSRITTRRALDELVAAGLARREQGRGTRVTGADAAASARTRGSVEGLIENVLALGLKTTVEVFDFAYIEVPSDIAERLALPPGAIVQRAVHVRHLDGAPLGHIVTHVPEDIGRLYDEDELTTLPLLALLERKGVAVRRAEQAISATPADPEVARRLAVDVGTALLQLERTVYDDHDHAVETITVLYRPDRYQYRTALERTAGDAASFWMPAA